MTRHDRASILSVGRTNRILGHDHLDLSSTLLSTCDRGEFRNLGRSRGREYAYGFDSISALRDLAVQIVRCNRRKTSSGSIRRMSERFSRTPGSGAGGIF